MVPISGSIEKRETIHFKLGSGTPASAPATEDFHVADKEKKVITTNKGTQIEFKGTLTGAKVKYSLGNARISYEINEARPGDQIDNVTFWRDEEGSK